MQETDHILLGLTRMQTAAFMRVAALLLPDHKIDLVNNNDLPIRAGALLDQMREEAASGHLQSPIWHDYDEISLSGCRFIIRDLLWEKPDGTSIRLTEKERDLLMVLYCAEGRQASRDDLLAQVWGYRADLETHTLETHIYRLRQKIEANADTPMILLTIPNGYKLG